jgi:hypothetical protein
MAAASPVLKTMSATLRAPLCFAGGIAWAVDVKGFVSRETTAQFDGNRLGEPGAR